MSEIEAAVVDFRRSIDALRAAELVESEAMEAVTKAREARFRAESQLRKCQQRLVILGAGGVDFQPKAFQNGWPTEPRLRP